MKETAYQGMTAINFTITLVDDWKSNNTITVQRGKFGARGYGRESGGQYISVSAPRVLMSQLSGGSTYLPENQKSFNLIVNLINTLRQVAHNKDQMAHIWQMFVQSAKAQQMKDAE
jgi:hypothetical protein